MPREKIKKAASKLRRTTARVKDTVEKLKRSKGPGGLSRSVMSQMAAEQARSMRAKPKAPPLGPPKPKAPTAPKPTAPKPKAPKAKPKVKTLPASKNPTPKKKTLPAKKGVARKPVLLKKRKY